MNRFQRTSRPGARLAATVLAASTLGLSACSGSGGGSSGTAQPLSTSQSVVVSGPVEIVERYLAYLADEATTGPGGTDWNGDGDVIDAIAVVANVASKEQRVLNVAATNLSMVRTGASGTHLFLSVDEALDGQDWDGDLVLDDLVLLHTNVSLTTPLTFVSLLGDDELSKVGDRVYFSDPGSALMANETSLLYVNTAAPTAPVRVLNADLANTLAPEIMTSDEGLLFLSLDETVEMRDLNGDLDMLDTDVLALLDGTDPAAAVVEVGLALQDDSTPVRALSTGASWLVAFLVDEASQGATNLNDPTLFAASWKPPQCAGFEDADALDQVLHFLDYAAFVLDPMMDPPVNTGLVGSDRVLALQNGSMSFVATISTEADEGTCDLNGDGDMLDDILRWAEAVTPVLPFASSMELLAQATVAGGDDGAAELGGRFVAVISELEDGRDHDGSPGTDDDLIAWLDPTEGNAAFWEFDHSDPGMGSIAAVGTGWLAEQAGNPGRLGVAFPEAFFGDINGDGDALDSVPTFVRFNGAGTELDFPGPAVAVAATNAGIEIVGNLGFYRVDENADDRDWNNDGDKNDFALFRTTVSTLQNSYFVGTLNNLVAPAVTHPDPSSNLISVTFVADESAAQRDFNGDGDTNDMVLRWLRID